MKLRYALLTSAAMIPAIASHACDCAMELPGTLCETMDPDWAEPDVVVLGVKLDEIYYGMHVRVLQVFHGAIAAEDVLTVWGDNGALCRWYVSTWAVGDTVIWAFNNTDFLGNEITAGYPPDLEQAGDYHISMCGTYWLPYANGVVSGGIAPGVPSAPIEEFWPAVMACMNVGLSEGAQELPITVRQGPEGVLISMAQVAAANLEVIDIRGSAVLRRSWNGEPLLIQGLGAGTYLARVTRDDRSWSRRFFVQDGRR